jgi:hypothetical protein
MIMNVLIVLGILGFIWFGYARVLQVWFRRITKALIGAFEGKTLLRLGTGRCYFYRVKNGDYLRDYLFNGDGGALALTPEGLAWVSAKNDKSVASLIPLQSIQLVEAGNVSFSVIKGSRKTLLAKPVLWVTYEVNGKQNCMSYWIENASDWKSTIDHACGRFLGKPVGTRSFTHGDSFASNGVPGAEFPSNKSVMDSTDQIGMFEDEVLLQDGCCSDDACPCPETPIPRGTGYYYIDGETVAFRRKYPRLLDARMAVKRGEGIPILTTPEGGGLARSGGILMCEQAARLRNLDLAVAAEDARHWWHDGKVPLRPTPLNVENFVDVWSQWEKGGPRLPILALVLIAMGIGAAFVSWSGGSGSTHPETQVAVNAGDSPQALMEPSMVATAQKPIVTAEALEELDATDSGANEENSVKSEQTVTDWPMELLLAAYGTDGQIPSIEKNQVPDQWRCLHSRFNYPGSEKDIERAVNVVMEARVYDQSLTVARALESLSATTLGGGSIATGKSVLLNAARNIVAAVQYQSQLGPPDQQAVNDLISKNREAARQRGEERNRGRAQQYQESNAALREQQQQHTTRAEEQRKVVEMRQQSSGLAPR